MEKYALIIDKEVELVFEADNEFDALKRFYEEVDDNVDMLHHTIALYKLNLIQEYISLSEEKKDDEQDKLD